MKPDLLEILVCPLCKKGLKLAVKEQKEQEIITGSLYCSTCDNTYNISDSMPNLLPPQTKD
jgi:uncharacterized protein YbaR (Trm112 family)